jgi:transposase
MDTSATYARAARLALPNVVVVDRFHLVALTNRAVTEYRRELAWARRGRAGPEDRPGMGATEPVAPRGGVPHS